MELPKSDTMNLAMAPLLVIARWVHLWASILLAALFLFEIVIVAPYARKPAEINQPLFLSLHQLTRRIAWWIWSIVQISWNLLVLKPKLTVDLRAVHVAQQEIVIRSLLRNVLCEIGLGTGVILIVGLLGITPPPMR